MSPFSWLVHSLPNVHLQFRLSHLRIFLMSEKRCGLTDCASGSMVLLVRICLPLFAKFDVWQLVHARSTGARFDLNVCDQRVFPDSALNVVAPPCWYSVSKLSICTLLCAAIGLATKHATNQYLLSFKIGRAHV